MTGLTKALLGSFASLSAITLPAVAQLPTEFTIPIRPDYELVLFPGTPFNMGTENLVVPFSPLGEMGFSMAGNAINDPLATSADFTNISDEFAGNFSGTPYDLRIIQFLGGGLSNIVRNGSADIQSADVSFTAIFEQKLGPGSPEEVRVFGGEMTFIGTVDAFPFDEGTAFGSPSFVDLFLDTGNNTSVQIGGVQNRFLTVVPEPGSVALALFAIVGLSVVRR
ncbi:MAG: hypothetical protein R3E01_36615 [Pirellulaceae bacterium]|nr:hypothetical protein [Planctomycetales bacterium]